MSLTVHDLKNLAGRLALFSQNLAEHFQDPLFQGTALELLDDTVVHLRRLARDLREHEGRLVIKLRIDVNRALQDAILDRRPDLASGIVLRESYDALPPIWGDAFLLRAAFACAIENAIEAMLGKGALSTSTKLSTRGGRRKIAVTIEDEGPGMSEDFLRNRVFRPFTSTKEEGLGLGLYTIRQVAAMHDGTVRITSAKGRGICVRLVFPVEEE